MMLTNFRQRIDATQNIELVEKHEGNVNAQIIIGKDIIDNEDLSGILRAKLKIGADFLIGDTGLEATFLSAISSVFLDTLTIYIDVRIPAGGKLVIDSDNYTVFLNGVNAIDKHSGDWAMLARNIDKITFSPSGSTIKSTMLYTERYL